MRLGKGTLTVALTKSTAPKAGKMYYNVVGSNVDGIKVISAFNAIARIFHLPKTGRWKILAIALKAEMTLIP